jgi:hypothetical protein
MKKAKFFLLVAMFAASFLAYADWIKVGESNRNGGATFFYDPIKTVAIDGRRNIKRILTMQSYEEMQDIYEKEDLEKKGPYFSIKSRAEVDCPAQQYRIVALFYYSKKAGDGELVHSYSIPLYLQTWKYPPPNSSIEIIINAVCKG